MNAAEFIKKYQLPDWYGLDMKDNESGVQPRVGSEESLARDFKSLSAEDRYTVTRRFFWNANKDERAFLYRMSPLGSLYDVHLKHFKDGLCVDWDGSCLNTAHAAFKPLDRALSNPKADPRDIQWLVFVTRMFQEDMTDFFRTRLENNLTITDWENFKYNSLMQEWEKHYQTSLKLATKQGLRFSANRSPFFDNDADGVADSDDPDPIDPWTVKDTDGDGVDDLLDSAPADPKTFLDVRDLSKPSPKNFYNVIPRRREDGSEYIEIEAVIGLVPAAEDGVGEAELATLTKEFAERIKPHLDNMIPEGLRDSVGFAFAFTTDLASAHRVTCITSKSREEDDAGASTDLWPFDLPGLKILHEIGHLVFGLEDRYHHRTNDIYWEQDRTMSPHYRRMRHPKDLMIDKDYIDSQFRTSDVKRMIVLGTRRGQQLLAAGAFQSPGDRLAVIRSRYRFDERDGKIWLEEQAKLLAQVNEDAKGMAKDPFIVRHLDRLQFQWGGAFRRVWRTARKEIIKQSFDNIDRAIRLAEMTLATFVRYFHVQHKPEDHFFTIPAALETTWHKELAQLVKDLKSAKKSLKTKKLARAIGDLSSLIVSDTDIHSQLKGLKTENLPQDVRIRDASFEWVHQPSAVPKIRVALALSSMPPRTEKVLVEPMSRYESGPEFRKRVIQALKRELEPDMKTRRLSAEDDDYLRRRQWSFGAKALGVPGSPWSAGVGAGLDYRIYSGRIFFGPKLDLRYRAIVQKDRAEHHVDLLAGMFMGRDFGGWFIDLGLAMNVETMQRRVRPYAETEIGRRFWLLRRNAFVALGVGGNIHRLEVPIISLRSGTEW